MKTLMLVIAVLSIASAAYSGENTNTKLLLHATQPITEHSNWQTAGWVVVPNFTNPTKALVVAGPRYQQAKRWWAEVNLGFLTVEPKESGQPRDRSFIIDFRASYDALNPIHFYANIEHVPSKNYWYTYFDVNYRLPLVGLVGLESENDHFNRNKDNLSIGPRTVIPFKGGAMVLIGSYQFHNRGDDQVWFRTVINF